LTNSLFCLPRKIDIETLKTNDLMPLVWSCRRETHMVRGNTIWVWSMQIWPPKGLMLQTRLLSSHIALPFLYSKEGKESLRQFSPIHGTLVRTMFFYVLFCPNTNTKFCVGDAAESVYFWEACKNLQLTKAAVTRVRLVWEGISCKTWSKGGEK
jgi:hypothetical protein